MASAQYGQRGRSVTIDAHALHLWSGLADQPGGFLRILGLLGGNHDGGEMAKGRRMGAAAAFRFCTVESFAVIMHQRLDDGRRRSSRLDIPAAGLLAPTGAAGYLCDLMDRPTS